MPAYDYRCSGCGAEETVFRSMSKATEPVRCQCSKLMERVFSNPPAAHVHAGTPKYHHRHSK